MNGRRATLPLGIDVGRCRIRVALVERDPERGFSLAAVATRPASTDPAAALREAVRELATAERRCVIGIGATEARLRRIAFPPMSPAERRRAARFEAARDWPGSALGDVTLTPLDDGAWALGVARRAAVDLRRRLAGAAGLRVVAVDDVGFALERVHGGCDGTIDIGAAVTQLTVFDDPLPFVATLSTGGDAFTAAIAQSLGIDPAVAEERKRVSGFAGAGETQRDALIAAVLDLLAAARGATGRDLQRLVLTGNGSRVPGLAAAFARAAGMPVEPAELAPECSRVLPADVLRAAGADWSIAFGLALWETAA